MFIEEMAYKNCFQDDESYESSLYSTDFDQYIPMNDENYLGGLSKNLDIDKSYYILESDENRIDDTLGLSLFKNKLELYERFEPEKASDFAVFVTDYMIHHNHIDELDKFLSILDADLLGEWSITAILTSTFEAKNYLREWDHFYYDSFNKLKKDDLPVEEILWGFDR